MLLANCFFQVRPRTLRYSSGALESYKARVWDSCPLSYVGCRFRSIRSRRSSNIHQARVRAGRKEDVAFALLAFHQTQGRIRIMNDLEHELRRVIEGDIRFDTYSRLLYSTDASM